LKHDIQSLIVICLFSTIALTIAYATQG